MAPRKLRALALIESADSVAATNAAKPGVASPMADRKLNRPLIEAIFGGGKGIFTRSEAMKLPPVAKGRAVIIAKLAGAPLVQLDGATQAEDQPEWLYHTDGQVSPWHRLAWTLDDLIFTGWSLWVLERGEPTEDMPLGEILSAQRWPVELWEFDAAGRLMLRENAESDPAPIDESAVCLIPGPAEGLLEYAERSLRSAADLEESWRKRASNPIPLVELHSTDPADELTVDEQVTVINDYMDARQDVNGAVTYTPARVQLIAHGEKAPNPAIEARNFSKVDVANFLGLPAAALDGSLSTSTLTYSTQEGKRDELADAVVGYWGQPLQQRLSQDDMVPRGSRVRFDFSDLYTATPAPTGATTKD